MYRIPRKRLAMAVTGAVLPLLVLSPHADASVSSVAPSAMVSSASAPTLQRTTVNRTTRAKVYRTKWTMVHSSVRTAPAAHTVWTGSASFRATKRYPMVRLQVRQLVNGKIVTHKTKSIRSRRSGWKSVKVSIKPVSQQSTFQVLIRRGNLKNAGAKMRGMKVTETSPVMVAPAPTPPRRPPRRRPRPPPRPRRPPRRPPHAHAHPAAHRHRGRLGRPGLA